MFDAEKPFVVPHVAHRIKQILEEDPYIRFNLTYGRGEWQCVFYREGSNKILGRFRSAAPDHAVEAASYDALKALGYRP